MPAVLVRNNDLTEDRASKDGQRYALKRLADHASDAIVFAHGLYSLATLARLSPLDSITGRWDIERYGQQLSKLPNLVYSTSMHV